ncbi:response regulator [Natrinema salifodinae]|uniref:Response regulator receiver domain-containing protein n=1 Tax=Natrinema salifodinae TaxID=1202768 RepID=A0A1I0N529_9EURY|nr:response regulator [Natrinema salifodinae]SEV95735.1 Response regulator receiver domain-containing protein [Natrinema salifodinae]
MSKQPTDPVGVLLVEDDPTDARRIREAFEGLDTETSIRAVTDGTEALGLLTDHDGESSLPDFLLLDLDPSESDGRELLEALTDEPVLTRLPVLVLACSTTFGTVRERYELAVNAYLRKPTDPEGYDDLADAVAEFWFERAALPPTPA